MIRIACVLILVAVAALVAACGPSRPPGGAGAALFDAGYADGCRTAEARLAGMAAEVIRDEAAFDSSRSYRRGWSAGYSGCSAHGPADPWDGR